jgi:hypothetical protein
VSKTVDSKNEAHFLDYSVKCASSDAVMPLVQTRTLSLALLGYLYTCDLIARPYFGTITQQKCEIIRLN